MSKKEDHIRKLQEDLEPWLPRENEVGTLLSSAAEGTSTLGSEIEAVESGLTLPEANTKAELEQIAQPLGKTSDTNESLKKFRVRIQESFQKITSNGSPEDIVNLLSLILEVDKPEILLTPIDGEPIFEASVPAESIENKVGSQSTLKEILLDSTATTYGLDIFSRGTLKYITQTEWQNDNYDSDKGYATLDANDNVTDGGSYSSYYITT